MSRVRSKDTTLELDVRKYLFAAGFRYRLHDKKLPGKPDIVLPKFHSVIFVNGCFWHGHDGCTKAKLPASNESFWRLKISKNIERDKFVKRELTKLGWKVYVIWGCELSDLKKLQRIVARLKKRI